MKPEWRRFAPVGLYISLLAALASVGLYIVQREWTLALQISLGMIVVGLALFAILDPDRVRVSLTGRQARYGSNALVLTVAFVGILLVVNYIVIQNSKRWDLTEDKEFTLAAETLDTLANLTEPVTAQAFFTARISPESAESLLEQYKFHSNEMFDYEFIDPEADPIAAEQAKITRDGTIVLNMAGHQEPVTFTSEEELTGALVRLISPEARTVYFLTGHGEYSPEETGEQSYSQVKRSLESKNYTVGTLNLLATNQIPEDAKVIVIAGPRKPVSSGEIDLLSLYMANGGALIVMQEPIPVTEFGDQPDPMEDYLAQSWGITMGSDFVIDQTSNQPSYAIGSEWGNHQITEKLRDFVSIMPTARSVSVGNAPDGVSQETLVSTAAQAWAETDLIALTTENAQVSPDNGVDMLGPVPLAAVAENFQSQARVVAFGDSDFASDGFFLAYGNGDLFINSVDWSAGQEDLINLTPKDTTQRMILPPQRVTMNLIFLGIVIILPGLALFSGIVVWIRQRRRG